MNRSRRGKPGPLGAGCLPAVSPFFVSWPPLVSRGDGSLGSRGSLGSLRSSPPPAVPPLFLSRAILLSPIPPAISPSASTPTTAAQIAWLPDPCLRRDLYAAVVADVLNSPLGGTKSGA